MRLIRPTTFVLLLFASAALGATAASCSRSMEQADSRVQPTTGFAGRRS